MIRKLLIIQPSLLSLYIIIQSVPLGENSPINDTSDTEALANENNCQPLLSRTFICLYRVF